MNVVKIKIADQEIDFAFGLGFLGEALDELNISINDIQDKLTRNPFKIVPSLMYHSAKYAQFRKGKYEETIFTNEKMIDLIDSGGGVSQPGVILCLQAFTNSLIKGVPVDDTPADPEVVKKK